MVTKLKTNKVVGKVNNCCYEYEQQHVDKFINCKDNTKQAEGLAFIAVP